MERAPRSSSAPFHGSSAVAPSVVWRGLRSSSDLCAPSWRREMKTLSSPVITLLKHMLSATGQSGSLQDRCTFSGAGQGLRSAAQTWVAESKAHTMLTIDPGSLSMSYERIDTAPLSCGGAIGTSIGMEGSGLTGRSRTCVQTHAPTQRQSRGT